MFLKQIPMSLLELKAIFKKCSVSWDEFLFILLLSESLSQCSLVELSSFLLSFFLSFSFTSSPQESRVRVGMLSNVLVFIFWGK